MRVAGGSLALARARVSRAGGFARRKEDDDWGVVETTARVETTTREPAPGPARRRPKPREWLGSAIPIANDSALAPPDSVPSRHVTFACDNGASKWPAGSSTRRGDEIFNRRAEQAHPPVTFTQAQSVYAIEAVEIRDRKKSSSDQQRSRRMHADIDILTMSAALAGAGGETGLFVSLDVPSSRVHPLATSLSSPNYSPARTSTAPIPARHPSPVHYDIPPEPLDPRSLPSSVAVIRSAAPCRS